MLFNDINYLSKAAAEVQQQSMHLARFLIRFRWLCLVLTAVVTLLAGSQLSNLTIDNSNESFFQTGDPTKIRLDEFKETFGNDDFVFILVDVPDAFDASTLQTLDQLAKRLEQDVPHLLELTWVGNVESIEGVPGGIVIDELFPSLDLAQPALRNIGAKAVADPLYKDRLVSGDGQTLGLLLEFENYPELGIDPRKESPPVILDIASEFDRFDTHLVGGPIMDYDMDGQTATEAPRWMMGALLGMCLVLAFTTRSITGVLVPAATVILSVIWTMGLVAILGFTLNLLVILVPTLLLCVGIGDTMHVVAELQQHERQGESRSEALGNTLDLVTRPIVLTTLTTALGFGAFVATDLLPLQQLGIQAAIGVTIAFILTFIFAVPVLSFTRERKPAEPTEEQGADADLFDRILTRTGETVLSNPGKIALLFLVLTVAALVGMSRLVIETNTIQDLPKDNPLRVAFNYVDNKMGGSMSIELVVDSGRPDGIKDISLLRSVERLQQFLETQPEVTQTTSVLDQLKQMHRAVHENDPEYYQLPQRSAQVAEYLLLYESGGGRQLDRYVSFTYDQLRVQARTRSIAMRDVERLQSAVREFVKDEFATDIEVYDTGTLSMFSRIADLIAKGQLQSFTLAFIAIAIVMIITLRSFALGAIAMIPNVLPVVFALGAMGWAGAQLNMIGMVLAPMILGVAVDDTVHFFVRYRRYFVATRNYRAAYLQTLRTVGRPLLFTTLVLIVGFSGFLLSIFAGPRNFAWASMLAFSTALLAEFLLVPVLLGWLKPLGRERPENSVSETYATT
ncbi:MAG: MMPL family transporter [Pseudomonadota bacterium]